MPKECRRTGKCTGKYHKDDNISGVPPKDKLNKNTSPLGKVKSMGTWEKYKILSGMEDMKKENLIVFSYGFQGKSIKLIST